MEASVTSGPRPARPRRLTAMWVRLCLALFMMLLSLVGLEFGSRLVLGNSPAPTERNYPVEFTRRPRPYVMFGGVLNSGPEVGLNYLGYPGPAPTPMKPLGEYRIFMLGGSTCFLGQPSIGTAIERRFHQHGHRHVRVYNFGVISQVTGMELARVVFEIAAFQPDLIFHYSGGNDTMEPLTFDPRPGVPFNFAVFEANPLMNTERTGRQVWMLLASKSNLMRHFAGDWLKNHLVPLDEIRQRVGYESVTWREQIAAHYLEHLRRSQTIAAAHHADFLAIYQPMMYFKDPLSQEEQNSGWLYDSGVRHAAAVREAIRRQGEVAVREGLQWVDMSDMLDGNPKTLFFDFIHVEQVTHEVLADRFYEMLEPRVVPPPSAAAEETKDAVGGPAGEGPSWSLYAEDAVSAERWPSSTNEDGLRVVQRSAQAVRPWDVRVTRRLQAVPGGRPYDLKFRARADAARRIRLTVAPFETIARPTGLEREVALTPEWQTFRFRFQTEKDHNDLEWEFQLGGSTEAVELAELSCVAEPALEPVTEPLPPDMNPNPLTPADFRAIRQATTHWSLQMGPNHSALAQAPPARPGVVRVHDLKVTGKEPYAAMIVRRVGEVMAEKPFEFKLGLRADEPRRVIVQLNLAEPPFLPIAEPRNLELSTDWKAYTISFRPQQTTQARVSLQVGESEIPVELTEDRHEGGAAVELSDVPAASGG